MRGKSIAGPVLIAAWCAASLFAWQRGAARRPGQSPATAIRREVAVTFDDLPLNGPEIRLDTLKSMTDRLTASIQKNHVPVVGFVNEQKIYKLGEMDARTELLKMWLDRGGDLGNHTYSHFSLTETPLEKFEEDVVRGETVSRLLLAQRGMQLEYFRYPFLHTGPTLEVRKAFEDFLRRRGYENAPVTVDNSDYVFATIYTKAWQRGDRATMQRVAEAYVPYLERMFDFYEKLSVETQGREIPQILLLHANLLNADYFDDIVQALRKRGSDFIPLKQALEDTAYHQPDGYAGKVGASWLERWAYTRGMKEKINADPDPPQFVIDLYKNYR